VAGEIFQVQANDGTWVQAKFLEYNGEYVVDPNTDLAQSPDNHMQTLDGQPLSNPNSYLIVPADYDVSKAADYGDQLRNIMEEGTGAPQP
jgi:hypothetical protein